MFYFVADVIVFHLSKRLLALAAQKFVSDIATDAFQYCKVRQQSQKRAPGKVKKWRGEVYCWVLSFSFFKLSILTRIFVQSSVALVKPNTGKEDSADYGGSVGCAGRVRHQCQEARLLHVKTTTTAATKSQQLFTSSTLSTDFALDKHRNGVLLLQTTQLAGNCSVDGCSLFKVMVSWN